MLDTLYRLKMTALPGYWDADHDRPRRMNIRPSNAQCASKSPTFSLRTSILLLASVILAPNRKYTTRHFSQKTLVTPLCEWISLNCVLSLYRRTEAAGNQTGPVGSSELDSLPDNQTWLDAFADVQQMLHKACHAPTDLPLSYHVSRHCHLVISFQEPLAAILAP